MYDWHICHVNTLVDIGSVRVHVCVVEAITTNEKTD